MVANHMLPCLSSMRSFTTLLHKPSASVKCMKDFPSYLQTPRPSVPNHMLPFLSSKKHQTNLMFNTGEGFFTLAAGRGNEVKTEPLKHETPSGVPAQMVPL